MQGKLVDFQPQTVAEALILSEAHLRAIGRPEFSPLRFVKEAVVTDNEVTAAFFPFTALREKEVLPGLKLRSGNSILEIVRLIPTNKEVVYKNNRGGVFRMPVGKFVKLAQQQNYRKIWNIRNFLISLKELLKPVLDSIPLMWVMKWILKMVRGKQGLHISDKLPKEVEELER